ncbi:MAG: CarD family transcriptional regulator [Pseudoflavonifractor sp.]|nr:CarD family transcriptional regulator [Pseudoflavonifractor sp.]
MYEVGDLVVYGRTGVCRVERIDHRGKQDFYALKPLYQACDIYTPVNGKVFIRPVISKEEAHRLIDLIPTVEVEVCESKAMRELTEHYQSAIDSHDCQDLIELTMSLYAKKKAVEGRNRKFGAVDERFMKEGEELLFGELAAALGISVENVQQYIAEQLHQ